MSPEGNIANMFLISNTCFKLRILWVKIPYENKFKFRDKFFGGAIILITFVKVEFTVIGLGREFGLFCKF